MFFQDRFNHGLLGDCFTGLELCFPFEFEIVDVKTQHVAIFNGVGDGVVVQLLLENIFCGFVGCLRAVDFFVGCVFVKNWCAGKSK